jgi:serine/threonine protein kinase
MMTPKYCPPGTLRGRTPTLKSDIFSLGCVFLEIITVELGHTLKELNDFILENSPYAEKYVIYCKHINSMRRWLAGLQEQHLSVLQCTVIKFCYQMLDPDPKVRPRATDICTALKEVQTSPSTALLRTHELPAHPIETIETIGEIERIVPNMPLLPSLPNSLSAWLGNTFELATESCDNDCTRVESWLLSDRDIDLAELMLAKLCASVVSHVNKFPQQLDSLTTIASSLTKPGLLLEDVLMGLPEPLHILLCGYDPTSAAASQLHSTSGHNAHTRWEHTFRSVKHIIRTVKRLNALTSTTSPTITTSTVIDLDEQITQSLNALDIRTHSMAMAFARTAPNSPPRFVPQTCQETRSECRKRAMSKTLLENPPAKINTSNIHVQWEDVDPAQSQAGLVYFDQTVVTFERGTPVLTNVSYHNGSQYFQ